MTVLGIVHIAALRIVGQPFLGHVTRVDSVLECRRFSSSMYICVYFCIVYFDILRIKNTFFSSRCAFMAHMLYRQLCDPMFALNFCLEGCFFFFSRANPENHCIYLTSVLSVAQDLATLIYRFESDSIYLIKFLLLNWVGFN